MKNVDFLTKNMAKVPHPSDQPAIRKRIKELILEKYNDRQGELAQAAGIQPAALSKILNGKADASIKQLQDIERASRARLDWLLSGAEPCYHPVGWVPQTNAPIKEGEFLRRFVEARKSEFSQTRLAATVGVSKATIQDYFTTAVFDPPTRQALLTALRSVTGDDTLTDENIFSDTDSLIHQLGLPLRALGNFSAEPVLVLPFVPLRARAGVATPRYWEHPPETTRIMRATLIGVEPDVEKPKRNWWVIEIDGDSMEPQLISRARVLAYYVPKEAVADLRPGVWAIQYEEDFVIKRIRANNMERDKGLMLYSDNPPPDPYFIKADSIRHVWCIEKTIDSPVR